MLVHSRYVVICALGQLLSPLFAGQAQAFDPFTVAQGAQAVSGILGGLDKLDEAASAGFALTDLLSELDIDTAADEEIERMVGQIEAMNSKARELKYSGRQLQYLLQSDSRKSQSFAARVRQVRDLIRTSKRIAAILGVRPKAGEKALQVQQTRINHMILEELMALRRLQFEEGLRSKEQLARYELALAQVFEEEGRSPSFSGRGGQARGLK